VKAYIGLGSNLGRPADNVSEALHRLAELPGVDRVRASSLYDTEPVSEYEQPAYVNAAAELETALSPRELLEAMQHIQRDMGQQGHPGGAPRLIDLDLLLYEGVVSDDEVCTLPHPRMHERAFVLVPLCELAPTLVHPQSGKTLRELCDDLPPAEGATARSED